MSISGEKKGRAFLRKNINFKKWMETADEISRRYFVELKRSGFRLSDEEVVLLIEIVDDYWAKHENIEAVIGGSRAEEFGLKIQAVLNRMICDYDQLNVARREAEELEAKRLVATGQRRRFLDFVARLRKIKWSSDDLEMVRAAHWAIYG